jgi:hypothetical protein
LSRDEQILKASWQDRILADAAILATRRGAPGRIILSASSDDSARVPFCTSSAAQHVLSGCRDLKVVN